MSHDEQPNVLQMFDLRGRVALVTGAGGHLGSALASALAEAGGRVVVTSRDANRAASVAASLPDTHGVQHFGVELDQLDADSIERCIAKTIEATGRIDVLVNNAHEKTRAAWNDVTAEEFNRQLTNATGYFLLARHVRNDAVRRASRPAS